MAPNPRVTKAFHAMREIGINEEKTKPVLKKLLKLYDKNWELIEEENYRALADAIFDDEEKDVQQEKCKNTNNGEMEEDNQASDEPERPLKRLRLRGQEGQVISTSSGSGHNVSNGSALKIPKLEENLLPDTSVIKKPQPNESKTPETDSSSLRRMDKGKRPLLPQVNQQVNISASDRTSLALRFKEPMIESGVVRLPKKRVSDDHALIKPKDEPFTDDLFAVDTFHNDQPIAVIHPDFSRKGSYSSGSISNKKNDGQDAPKSNFVDGDNRCGSAVAICEKGINNELSTSLEGPPPNLEIASSQLGEVKISLSCDSAIGRLDFRMPSRDAVIKYLEEKCLRSYKIIDPSFSVMKILSNMCECFLELGTDSPNESQEGSKNNMPPVECAKKSIVGEASCVSADKENLNTESLVNEPFMLPFKAGIHAPDVSKVSASSNEVDGDIVDPTVNIRTKMLSENELYVSEISKVSTSLDGVDVIIDPREDVSTNIYSENDGIHTPEISKASTSSNGVDEHIVDPSKNNMPPVECAKKSIVGEASCMSADKENLNAESLVNEPFMLPFKAGVHAPDASKVSASSNEVDGDIVDPTVNIRTEMLSENELYVSEISKVSTSSDGVDVIIDPRKDVSTNIYSKNDGIHAPEISKASTSSNGVDEHIVDPGKNNMPPVECAKKSIVGEASCVSADKENLNAESLVNEPFMLPFKAGVHAPDVSKVSASSNEVDGDIIDPTVNIRTKMLSENELYVSEISKVSTSSDGVDEHIIDPRENISANIYSENDGIHAPEISKASTSSKGVDEHIVDPSKNISTIIHSNCDGKNKLDSLRMVVSSSCQLKPDDLRVSATTDDITKGEERVKISWVNEVNDENLPPFQYIPSSLIFRNAYANISLSQIEDDNCCKTCFGDCVMSSTPCACAQKTGGDYAYTSEGHVKGDFLEKSMSLSLDPLQIFYCIGCPIERSKNDASDRSCKGHFRTKLIKECWRKCGCHRQCGNRVVQRGITYNLQVFLTSNEKGWGLRTLEDIPKGAFVCEYVGEILTCEELTSRMSQSATSGKHTSLLLLDSFWDGEVDLKDEKALCLDATNYGNVGRFINHRCSDANLVNIAVEIDNPDSHYYHLAFFTTRKVDAMEELTWDYGIDFDDPDHVIKLFQCQCGSKFCRYRKS